MNILSLFDGISCGRVALERAGIKVDNYFASEIDKYAIQIAQKNYPDTVQLWDVKEIDGRPLYNLGIGLLIGGSPCQGFSFAGKQLNFDDPRSALFFEFVRVLKAVKPKYFLLENVRMKKEYQDVISELLGVEPIMINSALVSAQNRVRLYWTNIPNVGQPEDKEIYLKDIIESGVVDRDKSYCIDANYFKGGNLKNYFEKSRRQLVFNKSERICSYGNGGQGQRVYNVNGKSISLSALGGGQGAKTGLYAIAQRGRNIVDGKRKDIKGAKTEQRYETSLSEKSNCITSVQKDSYLLEVNGEYYVVRKLTPIECERLQTLHDNYTEVTNDLQIENIYGNIKTLNNNSCLWKNVLSQIAKGKKKQISVHASCTIKDIKEEEVLNYFVNNHLKNVNIVIGWQLQEKCATSTIKIGIGTKTHYIPIKLENITEKQLGVNMGIYETLMENGDIETLWRNILGESSEEMRLFIISMITNLIIGLKTYIYAQEKNTCVFTVNLEKLLEGYLIKELSVLKMENISYVSNTQRYKALGNGWTVDVIAHIFKNLIT